MGMFFKPYKIHNLLGNRKYHKTVIFIILGQPKLWESLLNAQAVTIIEKEIDPNHAKHRVAITLPTQAINMTLRPPYN
jgi:hypothetical protein